MREIVCLCRRAELHWKQSLLLLQESPSVHASFKFHLRRRRPTEAATAVAGNFPWQSLPSLPSHPPSPPRSLWCQCGDEPKECSTLCGAPISSIKSDCGRPSCSITPRPAKYHRNRGGCAAFDRAESKRRNSPDSGQKLQEM